MTSEIRRDLRHAIWSTGSTGVNAVCGFLSGLLLISGLVIEQYGLVSSALAILLVVQELIGKGIDLSILRLSADVACSSKEEENNIFRGGLILKLLVCGISLVVTLIFSQSIAGILGRPELAPVLPVLILAALGNALWGFILTRRQAHLEFLSMSLLQPVSNVVRVVCFLLFIALGIFTWVWALWIVAASLLLSALFVGRQDWYELLGQSWSFRDVRMSVRTVWRYGSWNIVAAAAYLGYSRMDIFVLNHIVNSTQVAIYNASWQILTIMDLLIIAIMAVMTPKVTNSMMRDEMLSWLRRCVLLSMIAIIMALPFVLTAAWYIPGLFGAEYSESSTLVNIMCSGYILTVLIFPLSAILYALGRFGLIAVIQIALLCISMPLYIWAAANDGIVGASWATLVMRCMAAIILGIAIVLCLNSTTGKQFSSRLPATISDIDD